MALNLLLLKLILAGCQNGRMNFQVCGLEGLRSTASCSGPIMTYCFFPLDVVSPFLFIYFFSIYCSFCCESCVEVWEKKIYIR